MSSKTFRILKACTEVSEKTNFYLYTEFFGDDIKNLGKVKNTILTWSSPKNSGEEAYLSAQEAYETYESLINNFKKTSFLFE